MAQMIRSEAEIVATLKAFKRWTNIHDRGEATFSAAVVDILSWVLKKPSESTKAIRSVVAEHRVQ